jgi:hypothetical protein
VEEIGEALRTLEERQAGGMVEAKFVLSAVVIVFS